MKIEPNFDDLKPGQGITEEKKMPKIKIHYAVKNLDGDIPFIEIDSIKEFYDAFMCSGYFENVRTFEWVKKGDSFDECVSIGSLMMTKRL